MSILIKGMEMPASCGDCPLGDVLCCSLMPKVPASWEEYTVAVRTNRRHSNCPLIEISSADVAPVVHGKWVKTDDDPEDTAYQCSVCGKEALYKYNTCDSVCSEYCPNCGAKMDLLN